MDKTIRLWDISTCKSDLLFKGYTKDILCQGFSHDDRIIFFGTIFNLLKYSNIDRNLNLFNDDGKWVN